jgi:tetratricopeptide (TPR) repeat protein
MGAQQILKQTESLGPSDSLFKYAVRKILLRACVVKSPSWGYLVDNLISACSLIGEYEDIIVLSKDWKKANHDQNSTEVAKIYCDILGAEAKAHRNLGHFEDTLTCYRHILSLCSKFDLSVEKVFQLLMIGKMYDNYAGQFSLYRFFTELALKNLKSLNKLTNGKDEKILKYLAISYDSLGQIHRRLRSPLRTIVRLHQYSRRIHEQIGNKNGASRTICHEYIAKFYLGVQFDYKDIIENFSKGLSLLSLDSRDKRGYSVRSLQFADILIRANNIDAATSRVKIAKDISKSIRDYKTYVRACLLYSQILRDKNPQKSYSLVSEAQSITRDYNLLTLELASNQASLDHPARPLEAEHSSHMVSRTKEIMGELAGRASSVYNALQVSRTVLGTQTTVPPEFEKIDLRQRAAIMAGVIHDFQWLAEQANGHFHSLALTLERSGRRAIDEAGMSLGSELARVILHDLAHALTAPRLEQWREPLSNIISSAEAIRDSGISDEIIIRHSKQILMSVTNLSKLSPRFTEVRERMLSDLAAEKWGEGDVSLCLSAKRAFDGLVSEGIIRNKDIAWNFQTDIQVAFYPVWIERVLEYLLRNAVQHVSEEFSDPKIKVGIFKVPDGESIFGNPAVLLKFCIANRSQEGQERDLEKALQNPGGPVEIEVKVEG